MILRRACQFITPLECIHRLLTSEELNGLYKGHLALFRANRIAAVLSGEDHPVEARERLLQVRDEALRVPPDFVLELENSLRKRLPIHILKPFAALVIRSSVKAIEALWQVSTTHAELITIIDVERHNLGCIKANAAVFCFRMLAKASSKVSLVNRKQI